ncbi:MAG: hypothetical protein ACK5LZ_04785 [Anaerorhabdus sp.]
MAVLEKFTKNKNKKELKKITKKKKAILKTLQWIDIEEIGIDYVDLKSGGRTERVLGIKIIPPNIFLDTSGVQNSWVQSLQFLLSCINVDLYHAYVYTPIELTDVYERISKELEFETNPQIKEMHLLDLEVMQEVERNIYELSFFIMIKSSNIKKLNDSFAELKRLFISNGFEVDQMNKIDFSNLIKYEFESQTMLDVYLSTGEFELLGEPKIEVERGDEVE